MSRDAMDWARQADVGSVGRKAVLKELAYRAHGPDHSCEVSQRQLAEAIDQSERTVRRHLGDLESAGLLRREAQARPGRGRWIDRYVLHVDDPGRPANGDSRPANGDSRPANGDSRPANGDSRPATCGRGIGDPKIPRRASFYSAPHAAPEDFEKWWSVYPVKIAKADARKAWERAVTAVDGDVDRLIAGAQRYGSDPNRDPAFTAHPAKWLNGGRWDDPPLPWRMNGQSAGRHDVIGAVFDRLNEAMS